MTPGPAADDDRKYRNLVKSGGTNQGRAGPQAGSGWARADCRQVVQA